MQTGWKLLLFIFALQPIFLIAQNCEGDWLATTFSERGLQSFEIETDADGNTYHFMIIDSSAQVVGSDQVSISLTSPTNVQGQVLVKYNTTGAIEWTLPFYPNSFASATAAGMTIVNNSIYVAGSFSDEIEIDGNIYLSDPYSSTFSMYVCQVDLNGNVGWVNIYTDPETSIHNYNVDHDSQGNILVGGYVQGEWEVAPGIVLGAPITTNFFREAFALKLSPSGQVLWAAASEHPAENTTLDVGLARSWAIISDNNDDVLIAGFYSDTITFGNTTINPSNLSAIQPFVAKIDGSTGEFLWAEGHVQANFSTFASFYGLEVDDDNNIYVIGALNLETDIDGEPYIPTGDTDAIFQKMDPDGNYLIVKPMGSITPDQEWGTKVFITDDNKLFMLANMDGPVELDGVVYNTNGFRDAYLLEADLDGTILSAMNLGGTDYETSYAGHFDENGDFVYTLYTDSPELMIGTASIEIDTNFNNVVTGRYCRNINNTIAPSEPVEIQIAPNPASNLVEVRWKDVKIQQVRLFDARGQLIQQQVINATDTVLELNLSNLVSGPYFIELLGDRHQQVAMKTIVKQ